ncbi:tRNA (adenosine(37)-N6)-dimethylallyltransferase MiaA [Candidatus Parcubacteria bacterium]|nr:tRNA (adenosine(37)-N6)-dimethylallyltransferase MiaA [Patescibacteria group bacterium]MBU4309227.1 tRNA (adenosine(37)-N6)-dimethylallyltransferase MiaA [Patescibacteria group bacterium]MBU4577588.1 tRNA (adenosine(37)-N6)-dimethylallyltransferase MiaA [Patescibacteria group bacterium]MCG2697275.1 tRNA (adenosine(37)-N6)-dimethylallyltransferase MiaA [Candidatus Parcubacteria bacterium]
MNKLKPKNKVVVILGPTASGKTTLGVFLANKFKGEIISADSRQVYRGMDIGTGKDLGEYGDTPYHLIDVVSPNTEFDLVKYKKLAKKAITEISERKKLPLVVGGTGFYIQSLVDDMKLSSVGPDKDFRAEMEKLSVEELVAKLEKLKPDFAEKLNNSERNNQRRLIRYVEIARDNASDLFVGKSIAKKSSDCEYLILGIAWPRDVIQDRIYKRLIVRLEKENMIEEVERLHKEGVSWKRLESFGLEYKFIAKYLQKKMTYDEMVEKLNIAIRQFAKKQMSWFQRWERQGTKINWVSEKKEAVELVKEFLKK